MSSSSGSSKVKDLYKVLNVSKTATSHEIKLAYRKLALALHPDRHDGCSDKADAFKVASEAYDTLSDHSKRKAYDTLMGHVKRKVPPNNYRKVYAPRPPPGFKIYDTQKHYDYHYGDGMMQEEVERARKRAQDASGRDGSYGYQSPLGKGFTFGTNGDAASYRNPYSKAPQGPPKRNNMDVEYEESHFYDMDGMDRHQTAKRIVQRREIIKERMYERRRNRRSNGVPQSGESSSFETQQKEEEGCSVM